MINIKGIAPEKKLFHNIEVKVYPTTVKLEKISYWEGNLRTLLSFSMLQKRDKKKLSKIPLKEIVYYLAEQRNLQISKLAHSIELNGVRVPLIILEKDGKLMDGNRRFFACHYLLSESMKVEGGARPAVLDRIPVWVIKSKDLFDHRTEQKILAEANFVSDYKVPWTLDVKARVIYNYFNDCVKQRNMTQAEAYEEIFDVYSVERPTVDAYIDTIKLCNQFTKIPPRSKKDKRLEIVQDKFVYFWEFRNKGYIKKGGLNKKVEIPKVKKLFFSMMFTDRFKNIKQIEPMIRSVRDRDVWRMLSDSYGSKIDQVEAIYREEKAIKSAEDKIRNFCRWLVKADALNFSKATIKLIQELQMKCRAVIREVTGK